MQHVIDNVIHIKSQVSHVLKYDKMIVTHIKYHKMKGCNLRQVERIKKVINYGKVPKSKNEGSLGKLVKFLRDRYFASKDPKLNILLPSKLHTHDTTIGSS